MRTIRELRRASVMLGRPGLPGTGVTSGQLADIIGKANRAETRQYDSRSWPTLNDAIHAVHALGGGELFVAEPPPAGADIVLKDKVYLTGRGIGATVLDVNTITGEGSLQALPAITVAIPRHSRTVTFASAPDLLPGDVFVIYNSADASFAPFRTYYRAGEFCRVASVSGSTVTLTKPTYAGYGGLSTTTAHKVIPIRTGVSNMTIRGTSAQNVIKVTLGTDLVFSHLDLSGTNHSHLLLDRCYDFAISNVKAVDYQPAVGLNYGINLSNCQSGVVANSVLETTRHGFVTGGMSQVGSVPVRDISVINTYAGGIDASGGPSGCNLHGNAEYIRFISCTMPAGFNPAGDHISVTDCDIWSNGAGYIVYGGELLGASSSFDTCRFHATRNHPASRGFVWMPWDKPNVTRTGGTFRFTNNTLNLGAYTGDGATTYGLYAYIVDANGLPSSNDVEITGNTFNSTAAPIGNAMLCAVIRATAGRTFRTIKATGISGDLGIIVSDCSPLLLDLSGNSFDDPAWKGIEVAWPATPVNDRGVITMHGTTVYRAHHVGIQIAGRQSDTILKMSDVVSLENAKMGSTGSSDTNSSAYLNNLSTAYLSNCVFGDPHPSPTQTVAYALRNITTLVDADTEIVGSVTTINRNGVTSNRTRTVV